MTPNDLPPGSTEEDCEGPEERDDFGMTERERDMEEEYERRADAERDER